MRKLFTTLAIVAWASAALPPPASATSPAWEGVWDGTIGNLPIRACFVSDNAHGAYYYLSHLSAIPLDQVEGQPKTFVESAEDNGKNPRWILGAVSATELSAQWVDGGRTLPVRLKRLSGLQKDENPCGSLLFHRPRLRGVGTTSKPATQDGVRITKIALDHHGHFRDVSVETFQLIGNTPQIRRINTKLIEPLSGEKAPWFECMRMAQAHSSYGGDWSENLEPKLITRRWISVAHSIDEDCGGAHPNEANIPRTFDLSTGREIRLHGWLNGQATKPVPTSDPSEDITQLTPGFRAFVMGSWKPQDRECTDTVNTADYWHIELTRTALVFTPDLPHAVQACGDDFRVPFARLAPYLSPAGKAGVASVLAESSDK